MRRRVRRLALALIAVSGAAHAADALSVCMAEDNPPLSWRAKGEDRGVDVQVARAIAQSLGRELHIVYFESKYEHESQLAHEVNALLSSGVCELASGYALLASELGAPTRPTARTPDYPGAKRPRDRPWVPLGTLIATRPYHTVAMGLVVRESAREAATLANPGDARIGVIGGTMAGAVVALYRGGRLRPQIVTLAQNDDVLAALDEGRIDAALVTFDRYDAWRLAHPQSAVRRTAYVHPLRINIGMVARSESAALVTAANRVIDAARASGDLQRWSEASGATWIAPAEPDVGGPIGLPDLMRE
jgi:ABC-type amino acid transport substrate-binding protein